MATLGTSAVAATAQPFATKIFSPGTEMKTDFCYEHSRVEQQAAQPPDIGWCYSAQPWSECFGPKRALLVLRLRSIAARRASTCWACLLCGPRALPLASLDAAKCVGIVRLPAAVDIVLPASRPVSPESLDTAVSNTGASCVESRRSIPRCGHQELAYGTPSSRRASWVSRTCGTPGPRKAGSSVRGRLRMLPGGHW